MNVAVPLAVVGLVLVAGVAGYRIVIGPTMADRVIAIDVLLVVVAAAIAVRIAVRGTSDTIDILIYVALLSFTGTIIAARFVEQGGGPE